MTSKQRVHAALEGRPVDRCPVTASYSQLYFQDHVAAITGGPWWEVHRWYASPVDRHVAVYRRLLEATPFELLQPCAGPGGDPADIEFVERPDGPYRYEKRAGRWTRLERHASGFAFDYRANGTRHVYTRDDIDRRLPAPGPDRAPGPDECPYLRAAVREFGRDHFVITGGVIGTLYSCGLHVGQTNVFAMLLDEPDLVQALCERITACNIAEIRRMAAFGGDAIYIDDATATSDMISRAMYERFSLPYMKAMVEEIHRLNHKAIVIYFGGVMDRLEFIAATGADALNMECSMKGFVNDLGEAARRIGERMALYTNIDPVGVLQNGTDADLEAEIRRQVEAGRAARGLIISTASPITPSTPLARVQRFLELGRELGARS